MSKKIVFGSFNKNKVSEIKAMLEPEYLVFSCHDFIQLQETEETESTLKGNAILKAMTYYNQINLPTFADDTGLEVEALNNEPGVKTARYAGENANADDNMMKLLDQLRGIDNRTAQFTTIIAYIDSSHQVHTFEGELKGKIAKQKFGQAGFGYDPIFIPDGYDMTLAQMTFEQKNKISHRKRALDKFVNFIRST